MSSQIPLSQCPCCGHPQEVATSPDGKQAPEPGDISICLACSTVNQFDESLKIVPVSKEILKEIMSSGIGDQIRRMQILAAGIDIPSRP